MPMKLYKPNSKEAKLESNAGRKRFVRYKWYTSKVKKWDKTDRYGRYGWVEKHCWSIKKSNTMQCRIHEKNFVDKSDADTLVMGDFIRFKVKTCLPDKCKKNTDFKIY